MPSSAASVGRARPASATRRAASVEDDSTGPTMFDLTFLGTSASVPSADRNHPGLLVEAGAHRVMIDCGEGTQRQLLRSGAGFRGPDRLLLTHGHFDHVLGIRSLFSTLRLRQSSDVTTIHGSLGNAASKADVSLSYEVRIETDESGFVCAVTGADCKHCWLSNCAAHDPIAKRGRSARTAARWRCRVACRSTAPTPQSRRQREVL
jgi:ribonuclease BN (tRNA processing enzyme)